MDEVRTVLIGTTSMVAISMCVMVVFFIGISIRQQKKFDTKRIYKHWVLFTGTSFLLLSLLFDLFGVRVLKSDGFNDYQIGLLIIYSNFVRIIGVGFIFSWTLFFLVFDISDKVDMWLDKAFKKKKAIT